MRWILILVMLYAVYKLVQPFVNQYLMGNQGPGQERHASSEAQRLEREAETSSERRRVRHPFDPKGVVWYAALVLMALMALLYLQEGRFLP